MKNYTIFYNLMKDVWSGERDSGGPARVRKARSKCDVRGH